MSCDREGAVGQVYGLMVGGVIFVAALTGIFAFVEGVDEEHAPASSASRSLEASNLLSLILGNAGAGWSDPDALLRFGLANGTAGGLDPAHIQVLNNDSLDAVANNLLEYAEARAALGLNDVSGFRFTLRPLDFDAALQQHDFSHTRALYVGDFADIPDITLEVGQGTIANANVALNASMGTNTGLERQVIDDLGLGFDNRVHLTLAFPDIEVQLSTTPGDTSDLLPYLGLTVASGDTLYDNKQYLGAVLPGKLSSGDYDLLVLGSGIDHSTLTANSVKDAVDDFVRGGGTLVVFGSPGANFNWMQPILDVSATAVSGPVTAVDAEHAILASPWDLVWETYPANDLGWTLGVPSNFENVLMQGGKPVVTVSNDGAIGSGNVFLSSIQPRAVAASLGSEEAQHFMFNMLLYDRNPVRDPAIVFGPTPPEGVQISSVVRTTVVQDGGVAIPVQVELLSWATS